MNIPNSNRFLLYHSNTLAFVTNRRKHKILLFPVNMSKPNDDEDTEEQLERAFLRERFLKTIFHMTGMLPKCREVADLR